MSNDNSIQSQVADQPPHIQNRWACIQAFQAHEFPRCIQLAKDSLKNITSPIEMRLLFVSLLRVGNKPEADEIASQLLPLCEDAPWDKTIIQLILGQIPSAQAISAATDEVQKCEAHFYTAMRLLHNGEPETARFHLLKIMELNFPESHEFLLAATEHELLPKPPVEPRKWWEIWKK